MECSQVIISLHKNDLSHLKHCCGKESVEYTPSDFDAIDISQKELDSLFTD